MSVFVIRSQICPTCIIAKRKCAYYTAYTVVQLVHLYNVVYTLFILHLYDVFFVNIFLLFIVCTPPLLIPCAAVWGDSWERWPNGSGGQYEERILLNQNNTQESLHHFHSRQSWHGPNYRVGGPYHCRTSRPEGREEGIGNQLFIQWLALSFQCVFRVLWLVKTHRNVLYFPSNSAINLVPTQPLPRGGTHTWVPQLVS